MKGTTEYHVIHGRSQIDLLLWGTTCHWAKGALLMIGVLVATQGGLMAANNPADWINSELRRGELLLQQAKIPFQPGTTTASSGPPEAIAARAYVSKDLRIKMLLLLFKDQPSQSRYVEIFEKPGNHKNESIDIAQNGALLLQN